MPPPRLRPVLFGGRGASFMLGRVDVHQQLPASDRITSDPLSTKPLRDVGNAPVRHTRLAGFKSPLGHQECTRSTAGQRGCGEQNGHPQRRANNTANNTSGKVKPRKGPAQARTCRGCGPPEGVDVSDRMTAAEAAELIDAIDAADPERAHGDCDAIMAAMLPTAVQEARDRLVLRCRWWACA